MHTMISYFNIGANGLMAAFLVMSALTILTALFGVLFYASSLSVVGMSLVIRAGWNLVGLFLSKIWIVSVLPMLALYNGIGGGAASAIATAEMFDNKMSGLTRFVVELTVALVGAASLSGSLIALAKLRGLVSEPSLKWGRHVFPIVMVIVLAIGCDVALAANRGENQPILAIESIFWLLGCALLVGALITLPFRRAQMPILISLYNGFAGLAIGLEGFILRNQALMIVGFMIGTARMLFTLMIAFDRGDLKQT